MTRREIERITRFADMCRYSASPPRVAATLHRVPHCLVTSIAQTDSALSPCASDFATSCARQGFWMGREPSLGRSPD